jgi:hypothetical protein
MFCCFLYEKLCLLDDVIYILSKVWDVCQCKGHNLSLILQGKFEKWTQILLGLWLFCDSFLSCKKAALRVLLLERGVKVV